MPGVTEDELAGGTRHTRDRGLAEPDAFVAPFGKAPRSDHS